MNMHVRPPSERLDWLAHAAGSRLRAKEYAEWASEYPDGSVSRARWSAEAELQLRRAAFADRQAKSLEGELNHAA